MKKFLVLTLITLMMLSLAAIANAEDMDFEPAYTGDNDPVYQAPANHYQEPASRNGGYDDFFVAPVMAPVEQIPAAAPELPPVPQAETSSAAGGFDLRALQYNLGITEEEDTVIIADAPVPMSDGLNGLFVAINPDTLDPQYGQSVTLNSFIVNPNGAQLSYQWQIDRGFGWENILDANAKDYTFDYTESVSGCAFRLFVDLVAC